jgi:class 3 adenylate cyclase
VDTCYARSGDVHIAYQVHGEVGRDLIWVPSYFSHVEVQMEQPDYARFVRRLSAFARVIIFDKRGTGMSDPVSSFPTLEERIDDLRAVLDAAGSERATVMGTCEGGALAALYAATHPTSVDRLVLCNSFSRATSSDGYPWGVPPDSWDAYVEQLTSVWGEGRFLDLFAPSALENPAVQDWWRRYQRLGVSPGALRALMNMNASVDVTSVLAAIHVPTLVLHAAGDQICRVEEGEYLARHIDGATFVELQSADHYPWFDASDAAANEIERFVTGAVSDHDVDRSFMTVLFFDVVDSTATAAELGDKAWRALLEQLYTRSRTHIRAFTGREVKTLGDGMMAVFERPSNALRAAAEIRRAVVDLGLVIRAGVHCGDCELCGDDIAGLAVHVGARVMAAAGPGEVMCSQSVIDIADRDLHFRDVGRHKLRGVPGDWQLFALAS